MVDELKILCVLKTGGDYSAKYVSALQMSVNKYIFGKYEFICLTDDSKVNFCDTLSLGNKWKGWWSKIEIFTITGPSIYFDLDTVVVGDLTSYIQCIRALNTDEFIGVRAFNPIRNKFPETKFNSGVMGWNGDFKFVYDKFDYSVDSVNRKFCGDQDYISKSLRDNNVKIKFWQDKVKGLYSYKRQIRPLKDNLPKNASVVCYHGTPRPHQAICLPWMQEWRKAYCEK